MIGKFKPRSFAPNWVMPNKPIDIETNEEARKKYRRAVTDAMNARVKYLRSECVRTERTLELVKLFEGRTFYFLGHLTTVVGYIQYHHSCLFRILTLARVY